MEYTIFGDNLQLAILELNQGELVYAEAGAMVYMSGNMNMQAKAKGGFMKGLKRKMTGESFFVTEFFPEAGTGIVAFGGNVPGTIKAIDIYPGKDFITQKDAFLCGENGIDLDIAFQKKLGSAFFGGEGFILQKVSGQGTVFIHACGDFVEMDLEPGQTLKVDTGSVVGWDSSVQYEIKKAGGIKTALFGGEGLFLTHLTGPGKVILQSMTIANLAGAIVPFVPGGGSSGSSFIGALLKG
jgi:uncharacterized protein (TIGR00266 family)